MKTRVGGQQFAAFYKDLPVWQAKQRRSVHRIARIVLREVVEHSVRTVLLPLKKPRR